MADIEKLIRLKTARLESVPDELLSRIERVQKEVFPQVMELLMLLDRNSEGFIELTDKNTKLLSIIQGQLRDVLLSNAEYNEAIDEFLTEFEVQKGISAELFKEVFKQTIETGGKFGDLVTLSQERARKIFIDGITDSAFADAIYDQLDLAIANNASFAETVREIQSIVLGDAEKEGKLRQYAGQIAHDQFALSDRAYTSAIAEEIGAVWFLYSGNTISTSREFCIQRHNQYFHYKEIEAWASLDWSGKIDGTNAQTIFSTLGGWWCRHTLIPVSIVIVPRDVIERNIANGNFVPSKFEKEELELV